MKPRVAFLTGLAHFAAVGHAAENKDTFYKAKWYDEVSMFHFPFINATDMDGNKLASDIAKMDADYVFTWFYAPWCPHCQHLHPDYERLASVIVQDRQPKVVTTMVDCVRYEDACTYWGVKKFPHFLWGKPRQWAKNDKSKVTLLFLPEEKRNAESILDWMGKKLKKTYEKPKIDRKEVVRQLALQVEAEEAKKPPRASDPDLPPHEEGRADPWDIQTAMALLMHNAMKQAHDLQEAENNATRIALEKAKHPESLVAKKEKEEEEEEEDDTSGSDDVDHSHQINASDAKAGLVSFVDLLMDRFPEAEWQTDCRSSLVWLSNYLHAQVNATHSPDPNEVEKQWQFCGTDWETYGKRGWRTCKGSLPGKRGFTCGLWTTFHAISTRVEDSTALHDLQTLRHTVGNFFQCSECRDHFMGMPITDEDGKNREAVKMWWWKTHNKVNNRVKNLEEVVYPGDGDPEHKKHQFPTADFCPECTRRHDTSFLARTHTGKEEWDLQQVSAWIDRFYGPVDVMEI